MSAATPSAVYSALNYAFSLVSSQPTLSNTETFDLPKHAMHPLILIIELGFLWDFDDTTMKIKIDDYHLHFQTKSLATTYSRMSEGVSRDDLLHLRPFITQALLLYPPIDNRLRRIYVRAEKGLEVLYKVYASSKGSESVKDTINTMKQEIIDSLKKYEDITDEKAHSIQDPFEEILHLIKALNTSQTSAKIDTLTQKLSKLKASSIEESYTQNVKKIFTADIINAFDQLFLTQEDKEGISIPLREGTNTQTHSHATATTDSSSKENAATHTSGTSKPNESEPPTASASAGGKKVKKNAAVIEEAVKKQDEKDKKESTSASAVEKTPVAAAKTNAPALETEVNDKNLNRPARKLTQKGIALIQTFLTDKTAEFKSCIQGHIRSLVTYKIYKK